MPTDLAAYAARSHSALPSRLGTRYSPSGFLPEVGNTVVCHLDRDAPGADAVIDARARMMALPGAERFLYTPVESLHMTVFEGAIETRRTPDAWPAGMDLDAPIDEVTDALTPRFDDFVPPPAFSVRPVGLRPVGLTLSGTTDEDRQTILDWREALTTPFGYRHNTHDDYQLHMTFAYPLDWLSDEEVDIWKSALPDILGELQTAAPVLPLRAPAYCAFRDMTWFEELVVFEGNAPNQ